MAKRDMKDIESDVDGSVVTLTFAHGKSIVCDVSELNETVSYTALTQRIVAKLIDSAAISKDPKTGKSATVDEKYVAVLKTFEQISGAAGVWNVKGEGGGENTGILLQAFIRAFPDKKRESVADYYGKLSKEQRARWMAAPVKGAEEVFAKVVEIRAERAAKLPEIDVGAELANLPNA